MDNNRPDAREGHDHDPPIRDTNPHAPATAVPAGNAEKTRGKPSRTAWILGGTLAVLAIALGIWAYLGTRPEPAKVVQRDVAQYLNLAGELVAPPGSSADVLAAYAGPVERIHVSVGDEVREGDTLVEISVPSIEAAQEQAQQRVREAEQVVADARQRYSASVTAAEQRLKDARQQLERARAGGGVTDGAPSESAGSAAGSPQVRPPDANEPAGPTDRRAQRAPNIPGSEGVLTPPGGQDNSPDGAGSRGTAASATSVEQAEEAVRAAEGALTEARRERDEAIRPLLVQVEQARAALNQIVEGDRMVNVRAPISGTVIALNAQPGTEITTDGNAPVATIVNLDALQVHSPINPDNAGYVKPGMPVTLTFKGDQVRNQTFTGEVRHLTTRPAGGDRMEYVAIVRFRNEGDGIRPGMDPDRIAIKLGEARNVTAVPNEAVDTDDTGRHVVKVQRNGEWVETHVEIGLRGENFTEVRSGLQPGETIQVTPSLLHAGSR